MNLRFQLFKISFGQKDDVDIENQKGEISKEDQLLKKVSYLKGNEEIITNNLLKIQTNLLLILKCMTGDEILCEVIKNLKYSFSKEIVDLTIENDKLKSDILNYKPKSKKYFGLQELLREMKFHEKFYSIFIELLDIHSIFKLDPYFYKKIFGSNNANKIYSIKVLIFKILFFFMDQNPTNSEIMKGIIENDLNMIVLREKMSIKDHHTS